jgi:hypothetical protein
MNDKRHLDALKQRLKECEAQLPHSPPSHIYDPLHWFKLQEFKQKQNEVEMLNQQIANLERFLNHPNDCWLNAIKIDPFARRIARSVSYLYRCFYCNSSIACRRSIYTTK